MTNATTKNLQNTVSLTQGYWFYFKVGDANIAVHGSSWSGKETVYVNDEIVASIRCFRRRNKHCFRYNNEEYCIHFNMVNMWIGKLVCELRKDGELLDSQSLAFEFYHKKDGSLDIKKISLLLLPALVIGFVAGFIAVMIQNSYF